VGCVNWSEEYRLILDGHTQSPACPPGGFEKLRCAGKTTPTRRISGFIRQAQFQLMANELPHA